MKMPKCRPTLGQASPFLVFFPTDNNNDSIIPLKLTWMSCSLIITGGAMGFPEATEVDSAGVQQSSCAHHRIWVLGSAKRRPQRCGSSVLLYGKRDFSHPSEVQRVFFSFLTARPRRERYESARLDRLFLPSPLPASRKEKELAVETVAFHRYHQNYS